MNFEIPEGANVQIFIGRAPQLALTDQREDLGSRPRGRGIIGGTLKFTGLAFLVIGAFWVGEQRVQPAGADTGFAAPPPVNQAFPSVVPPPSQAEAQQPSVAPPDQVPPSFQAQLQTPPDIQPPPGQNPAAANGNQNAFGLSN
jgi:hypothetical protein